MLSCEPSRSASFTRRRAIFSADDARRNSPLGAKSDDVGGSIAREMEMEMEVKPDKINRFLIAHYVPQAVTRENDKVIITS